MTPVQKIADRLHAKSLGLRNILDLLAFGPTPDKGGGHFLGDLGQAVAVFSADALATFRDLVGHVFGLRSEPEMGGIYAGRSIALVQDAHPAGDRRGVDRVRVPMSKKLGVFACAKEAVSARVSSAIPNPAITALIDVAEKTNGWVFGLSGHEATLAFSEVV